MQIIDPADLSLTDKVVHINRCAKVVKGGRRFSFSALVVVGDGNGHVGFGLGKAREVPEAIRKGAEQAKKSLIEIELVNGTIPFDVVGQFCASQVVMRPASPGTGIIAGATVRAIVELAGVHNILAKSVGSNNPSNVIRATMDGLAQLRSWSELKEMRAV